MTATGAVVSCEVCLKEIPSSVARSLEGADDVCHFCGRECYERWRARSSPAPGRRNR